jgi:glycerophosphoryl diester phosphodiesterase
MPVSKPTPSSRLRIEAIDPATRLGWLTERPFAHRGLHDAKAGRPENSLAAFAAAVEGGYGIELDVRLARDGVAMVFHDGSLRRMCDREGKIEDLNAATLRTFGLAGTPEKIPTLAETLRLVDGRSPILVELKSIPGLHLAGPLERAVARDLANYRGPAAIISFNPFSIEWFRQHAKQVARGQLAGADIIKELNSAISDVMLRLLCWCFIGGPQFIAFEVDGLPAPLCWWARKWHMPVVAWTVRNPETEALAKRHANNFIFDQFRTA